jgi:hypothetical protein
MYCTGRHSSICENFFINGGTAAIRVSDFSSLFEFFLQGYQKMIFVRLHTKFCLPLSVQLGNYLSFLAFT